MKKIIKKIGTSAGVIFNKEDLVILDAGIGDVVDLGEIVVIKKQKKASKKKKKIKKKKSESVDDIIKRLPE